MKLTEFQKRVLLLASKGLNGMADARSIAECFPGWKKRAARGAMVGHVERAAYRMQEMGLVWRLSPKDEFETGTVAVRTAGKEWLLENTSCPAGN